MQTVLLACVTFLMLGIGLIAPPASRADDPRHPRVKQKVQFVVGPVTKTPDKNRRPDKGRQK